MRLTYPIIMGRTSLYIIHRTMRNTFGNLFTLTTFGESHGIAVGGVIDGFPAGIDIDMDFIRAN